MRILISLLTVFFCSLSVFAGMSNSIEYTKLYIVGSAVAGGWDYNATPMSRIDNGVFTWTGTLKANEPFKFMNSNNGWNKHVVATSKDELIKEGEIHHLDFYANSQLPDALDNKFRVDKTGEYVLTVDLRNMCVSLSKPLPAQTYPDKYYITGSALDDKVIELNKIENFEFKQSLTCKAGNIILMDTPVKGENTRYFTPVFEDVDLSFGKEYAPKLQVTTDANARGWSVSVPGDYIVYISCSDHKYAGRKHVPRKVLYITGGCCEYPWDYVHDDVCAFAPDPEDQDVLIWEGELRIGWVNTAPEPNKFKILTDKDWNSETYHPYIPDTRAEGMLQIRTTNGDDSKWTITKDGLYRISVNTRNETMNVELLSPKQTGNADGSGLAGANDAEKDVVELSYSNRTVELIYTPEPVEIKVINVAGTVVSQNKGITKGIVAENLAAGVYLVSVAGASVKKLYKIVL